MSKYTVLMIVPDYIANNYGEETYMTYVQAESVEEAQKEAQIQAQIVMVEDIDDSDDPKDFLVCFVCEGFVKDIHVW